MKEIEMNNKYSFILYIFLCIFSSCISGQYEIKGTVLGKGLESEQIYLVGLDPANRSFVDSAVVKNNTFMFRGKVGEEKMMIIRPRPILRFIYQEVAIVLEAGEIFICLDSISVITGTKQNDLLQNWKEKKEDLEKRINNLHVWLRNDLEDSDKKQIKESIKQLQEEYQNYNYNFIKQHWNTTVGQFVYKMVGNSLSSEQQDSLKLLEGQQT